MEKTRTENLGKPPGPLATKSAKKSDSFLTVSVAPSRCILLFFKTNKQKVTFIIHAQ